MNDKPLVILKRETGPADGFTTVTVADDVDGTVQIVIHTRTVGTDLEFQAIHQALRSREERKDAMRGEST